MIDYDLILTESASIAANSQILLTSAIIGNYGPWAKSATMIENGQILAKLVENG